MATESSALFSRQPLQPQADEALPPRACCACCAWLFSFAWLRAITQGAEQDSTTATTYNSLARETSEIPKDVVDAALYGDNRDPKSPG